MPLLHSDFFEQLNEQLRSGGGWMKTYKQMCQRPLVCAVSLLPHCLVLFFASGSEARVEAERRQSEGRVEALRENKSEIGHVFS